MWGKKKNEKQNKSLPSVPYPGTVAADVPSAGPWAQPVLGPSPPAAAEPHSHPLPLPPRRLPAPAVQPGVNKPPGRDPDNGPWRGVNGLGLLR